VQRIRGQFGSFCLLGRVRMCVCAYVCSFVCVWTLIHLYQNLFVCTRVYIYVLSLSTFIHYVTHVLSSAESTGTNRRSCFSTYILMPV